ncbi:MAG: type II toxin-antitoxin system RelE/ParE family toxin [Gammaproteobacteria bacterium]|nr:type II toxin-antitoxin system RelE/ParE family toxin [Gammaproteobacteria bacterium]
MIISFKHKGLETFFTTGNTKGIQPKHATKLRLILSRLDSAVIVDDVDFQGANLHQLKGNLKDHWSVKVNGNWRIIFKFEKGNAEIVDYQDYH